MSLGVICKNTADGSENPALVELGSLSPYL